MADSVYKVIELVGTSGIRFSEEEVNAVLGGNAARIFKL